MGVADGPVLMVRSFSNIRIRGHVPRIGRVFETGENRLHQMLEVDQGHVAPQRAAEFLVPVKDAARLRMRVRTTEEKLPIEDPVAIGIGDHDIADIQVFSFAHVQNGKRRVVPSAVAVVGVDVVFAGEPTSRGHVGPTFQTQDDLVRLAGFQRDLPLDGPGFETPDGSDLVGTNRERERGLVAAIEMSLARGQPVERPDRRMKFACLVLYSEARHARRTGLLIEHGNSQEGRGFAKTTPSTAGSAWPSQILQNQSRRALVILCVHQPASIAADGWPCLVRLPKRNLPRVGERLLGRNVPTSLKAVPRSVVTKTPRSAESQQRP